MRDLGTGGVDDRQPHVTAHDRETLLARQQEPGDSAIVSLATDGTAAEATTAARIKGSGRAGHPGSPNVSTSDQHAVLSADVLRRHVNSCHPATQ